MDGHPSAIKYTRTAYRFPPATQGLSGRGVRMSTMARIIALADDSIFFAVFSKFIGVAPANFKPVIRARFSAIFSCPPI